MDDTLPEIYSLLSEDEISPNAAIRLMLRAQAEMAEDIKIIKKTAAMAATYNEAYPSVTWLLKHKPKTIILGGFLLFIFFYGLFVPLTISDIRHALAAALSVAP